MMISHYHRPEFGTRPARPGYGRCAQCGTDITREEWVTEECPGPAPTEGAMRDEFAIGIPTQYGPASEAEVLGWPVLTCPICTRQHAHPPAVTATYWPMCFRCWEQSTVRSHEEE